MCLTRWVGCGDGRGAAILRGVSEPTNVREETIRIQLPDGSVREVARGTTPLEVATSISPRLAAAVVVARIKPLAGRADEGTAEAEAGASEEAMYAASAGGSGDRLVDLSTPLHEDVALWLLKEQDEAALKVVRHSAAHVMATAILELFPETKLGHGPATDSGFFYDVYREVPFTDADLAAIEGRMAEVVARDEAFVREEEPREKGLLDYEKAGEFMKLHFIERFTKPGEAISLYRNGHFTDFCRGPHVPSTGRVKAFKVTSVAGAYWLGDEKNQQLQRVYGTAFFNAKELDAHFKRLEEIKARDHRVLGKQLDLFSIQEVAGAGLIFWHPKGGLIRKAMEDWMRDECIRRGYNMVYTPHIMRRELWKISGHEGFYNENMYPPMELDDAEYRLKPMNCPGHILIYKNSPKSYRDLPVRYAELGNVYRYERSGTMHGLLRVRGFTQDDAHIFCTPEQIEGEVVACIDFAQSVLETFGFAEFKVELSTWDPKDMKSYTGSPENWQLAISSLKRALDGKGIPYKEIPGEAAFYGPKIDEAGGCAGAVMAAFDGAVRLHAAGSIPSRVHGRGWREASAGDGAPGLVRVSGAILWRADRALCGRVPDVAGAGAGGDRADLGEAPGLCVCGEGEARDSGPASGARCAERKDEREDPRVHAREGAVCAGDGR